MSTDPNQPVIVPFVEGESHRDALHAGKAVGPVEDADEWSVDEQGSPNMTLTFTNEQAARKHWLAEGGMLTRTTRTSWVISADWRERSGVVEETRP